MKLEINIWGKKSVMDISSIMEKILKEEILPQIIRNNEGIKNETDALKALIEELLRQFVRQNMRL